MIQRVQSLFLLEIIFLLVSLFFVPVQHINFDGKTVAITLIPGEFAGLSSTLGHYGLLVMNIIGITLSAVTLFMFKNRNLQIKLSYLLVVLFVLIISMISFCPLINVSPNITVSDNIFAYVILIVASISAYMASHFIKKDIELIKSSDRIR